MKNTHLYSGIMMIVLFAITGQYMARILELPAGDFDVQRMMYRASHIYLLWAGCLNTLLGCYWQRSDGQYLKYIQYFGSFSIILAQPVLALAFYFEPGAIDIERKLTLYGTALMLLGVVLTLVSSVIGRIRPMTVKT